MTESFDLMEFSRIAKKHKELGRESLTPKRSAKYLFPCR
jgi:hypothetical protein